VCVCERRANEIIVAYNDRSKMTNIHLDKENCFEQTIIIYKKVVILIMMIQKSITVYIKMVVKKPLKNVL
jgi:hypothetical protein